MPIGSTVIATIKGDPGDPGAGFPAGGATGQVLAKVSAADYDTVWTDATAGAVAWADVTGKPTFAPVATSGAYADLTGLPTLGSAASAAVADFATAAQGGLAASALQPGAAIPWADVTGKPTLFDGAYASLTGVPATFAPAAHNQAWSTITATPTTLAGYGISDAATAAQGALAASASQPGHTHAQSDVTGLVAALAGKAATVHTHAIADVTGLQSALDGKQPLAAVLTNTTAAFTTAQETKLAGVATGATANSADATLLARANHTGTQAASTIGNFAEAVDDRVAALVVPGTNMTITYDDVANTLTFNAAGGGAGTNLTYTAATRVIASDTGTDATLPLVTSGDAGLAPASGGGTTNFLRADGTWAAPAGGGGSALGNWDFWEESYIGNATATAIEGFAGAAVSSGTNNTALPAAALLGFNPFGVFLRSSTTANGGYRYQTTSLVGQYFGSATAKFRSRFLWRTSFTGRTVRIGFHDATTVADAGDGAYFEILDAVCSAKTANNAARTTNATTATLSLDTAYSFEIDVAANGASARFRVFAGTNETPILDVTNTTNIPTTSARSFGAGIIATEASTTASDIGILYSLGMGTIAGFSKATGRS